MTAPLWPDTDYDVDQGAHRNAERALCSTVLRQPDRLADVTRCQPHHFGHGPYRAIYATLRGLWEAGALAPVVDGAGTTEIGTATLHNLRAVQQAWRAGRFTDVPYSPDADPLHEVYFARPLGDSQHARYARFVVSEWVNRSLTPWADLVFNAATTRAAQVGELAELRESTARMFEGLAHMRAVLAAVADGAVPQLDAPRETSHPALTMPTQPLVAPHRTQTARAEWDVVHLVLTQPQWQRSGLLTRFAPEDFTQDARLANTWRAMQSLASQGEPIDYVTATFEVRQLASTHGSGLLPQQLAELAGRPPAEAKVAIDRLARAAMIRRAAEFRAEVDRVVGDPALTAREKVDAVQQQAVSLGQHAQQVTAAPRQATVVPLSRLARRLASVEGPTAAPRGRHAQ
jgi:hypothetical protein